MMFLSPMRSPLLLRTGFQHLRLYHSSNHPASPSYTPLQHKILSTALSLVPSTGFTLRTLTEGAKRAGYLEITHNLFPRGPWSLVEYHLVTEREAISTIPLDEGGVSKTIRRLCVERLKANEKVIGRWQEALAVMSLPENIGSSMAELARLSDEIWFLAGDRSVDFSWYTKRATLSAVYASTEVFMTTDKSENFEDTWGKYLFFTSLIIAFLDRRLNDVQSLGKVANNISEYLSFTVHALKNITNSRGLRF